MTESLFKVGVFTNSKLVMAALVSFLLQMGAVYLPSAQVVFKTHSVSSLDWLPIIALSSLPLWAMEVAKIGMRRSARARSI
jgi:Ca2+-transporting ATPase